MTDFVIEADALTKRYGAMTAVNGIDLKIRRGEVFGLLGPNGSGKTTTILMLLGLTDVTGGRVRVLGLDPARAPLAVKRRVGYMPDTVGFYEHLTARENLHYTGRLAGLDFDELDRRIDAVIEQVGLMEAADRPTGTFSSGMLRRLGLADVLLKQPEIAILDEPTNGLDPSATHEFLKLIEDLKRRNITVLLSSHLLERVQIVCDRVALFSKGEIALEGTVSALAQQVLGGGYRIVLEAGGKDLTQALEAIPGVVAVRADGEARYKIEAGSDIRPLVAARAVEAGGNVASLALEQPSLADVYTQYFDQVNNAA
jgi:ABC-2 type transport system ATP-binding protein